MYACIYTYISVCGPRSCNPGRGASPKQSTFCGLPFGAKQFFLALKHTEIPEVSGAQHCLAMEKRTHLILMQGLLILNLDKVLDEVELHLRRLPLLLAILATDPPKSSSL